MPTKPNLQVETPTKIQISQGIAALVVILFGAAGLFGIYFFGLSGNKTETTIATLQKTNETAKTVRPDVRVEFDGTFDPANHITLADIDGDREKETLFANFQGVLHAWNLDGTEVSGSWPVNLGDEVASAASVGNLDSDTQPEIVVTAFSKIYVLEADGQVKTNWPIERLVVMQTPLLNDFTGDGQDEIVLAGRLSDQNIWKVYVYSGTGALISPWPLPSDSSANMHSVSLGNLDADEDKEIVGIGDAENGSNNAGIFAWNFDGTLVDGDGNGVADWPQYYHYTYDPSNGMGQPTLADLDADGKDEVIHFGEADFTVKIYIWEENGTPYSGWPKALSEHGQWVFSTNMVVVGNIAGDSKPEIIATVGYEENESQIFVWDQSGEIVTGFPAILAGNVRPSYIPLVVDVNGDSRNEIVSILWNLGENRHTVYAVDSQGEIIQNNFWPVSLANASIATAVAVAPMTELNVGWLTVAFYGNETNQISWYNLRQTIRTDAWQVYKHDAKHTGRYLPPPAISPTE